jgi:hypothetical protein
MFTLSLSKILLTVLVIVAAWRGYRLLQQFQSRLDAANARPSAPHRPTPKATDLVECPRCGMFVPNGTICRSREECQFRRA